MQRACRRYLVDVRLVDGQDAEPARLAVELASADGPDKASVVRATTTSPAVIASEVSVSVVRATPARHNPSSATSYARFTRVEMSATSTGSSAATGSSIAIRIIRQQYPLAAKHLSPASARGRPRLSASTIPSREDARECYGWIEPAKPD